MLCYRSTIVNFPLKRSSDCKSKSVSLAGKEDAWNFLGKAELCIRIVVIDQTERDVHYRHLYAKFQAETGFEIAELAKRTVVNPKQ